MTTKILPTIQALYNLRNVLRIGYPLFGGIAVSDTICIAIHGFMVAQFAMIVGDLAIQNKIKIDQTVLLKLALYHDWGEAILSDFPGKSPSYSSYFDKDIQRLHQRGEQKARQAMTASLQKLGIDDYEKMFTADSYKEEQQLVFLCDDLAVLLEIIELKHRGYRHQWLQAYWKNQYARVATEIKPYKFMEPLLSEIKTEYAQTEKSANPFLTKAEFQSK